MRPQPSSDAKYRHFPASPREASPQVCTEEIRARQPVAGFFCMEAEPSNVAHVPTGEDMASTGADIFYRPSHGACPPPYSWNPSGFPANQQFPKAPVDYPSTYDQGQPGPAWLAPYGQPGQPPVTCGGFVCGGRVGSVNTGQCQDGVKLPQRRGATQLWEFLLDLLNEKDNEKVITWIDQETFTFRVIDPDELARRWGELKARPKMNYDKLSRSLRYYYQKKFLTKIASEKYVYRLLCHPSVLYASLGGPPRDQPSSKKRPPRRERLCDSSDDSSNEDNFSQSPKKRVCHRPSSPSPYQYCCSTASPVADCPVSKVSAVVQAPLSSTFSLPVLPQPRPTNVAVAVGSPLTSPDSDPPSPLSSISECTSDIAQTLCDFIFEVISSDELLSDEEINEVLPGSSEHTTVVDADATALMQSF